MHNKKLYRNYIEKLYRKVKMKKIKYKYIIYYNIKI